MLEVDENSRLGREVLGGGARLHAPAVASEDLVASLYERACDRLPVAGFAQYEISNFAQPGRPSSHNLKYWHRAPYLGFGLDAHSMLHTQDGTAVRWANPNNLDAYAGASTQRHPEPVDDRAAFEETVFLGLRLVQGLPWAQLSRFSPAWLDDLRHAVQSLTLDGLLGSDDRRFWLTPRGRLLSSEIFGDLLASPAAA